MIMQMSNPLTIQLEYWAGILLVVANKPHILLHPLHQYIWTDSHCGVDEASAGFIPVPMEWDIEKVLSDSEITEPKIIDDSSDTYTIFFSFCIIFLTSRFCNTFYFL
jgi:hypothetical protein